MFTLHLFYGRLQSILLNLPMAILKNYCNISLVVYFKASFACPNLSCKTKLKINAQALPRTRILGRPY